MDWWVAMPKVELHAHLNGSIRDSTLLELARGLREKGVIVFPELEDVILKPDHETVTRITKEVVEDFAAENVVYLELRTTPKRNDAKGMSKQSYMQAVLEGLRAVDTVDIDFVPKQDAETLANCHSGNNLHSGPQRKRIYVRLLLSIDRRETTEAAMETVNLALQMKQLGVVGIDLSGNPVIGEWQTFLPALKFAKEQGLAVTLHCGEVPNPGEIHAMLDFCPGRIGHACCFEDDHWRKLKSSQIPVEICLTSNIKSLSVSSLDVHHFADLYNSEHPLILCTDDSGVFSTSVSGEYILASTKFDLGQKKMFKLASSAVDFIFADNGVKKELEQIFVSASEELDL